MNLRQNLRMVVAMWIFVGLLGGPSLVLVSVSAFTARGLFQPRETVIGASQFAPGQEVEVGGDSDVGPPAGDFVILAHPASVDPSQVVCEWKSRVYSTGEQDSGTMAPVLPGGMADVVTDGRNGVDYRTVLTTDGGTSWMQADRVTCRGEGAETFAVADDAGLSKTDRTSAGIVSAMFGVLMTATGFVSLALTRRWSRQRSAGGPPPYGPGGPGPHANGPGQYPHAYQR